MSQTRDPSNIGYEANGPPSLVIAGTFSMTGFTLAVVSGAMVGRSAPGVIEDALLALLACYAVGLIVGKLANAVIADRIEQHKRAHPIPDLDEARAEIERESGIEILDDPNAPTARAEAPSGAQASRGPDGSAVPDEANAPEAQAAGVTSQS